MELSIQNRFTGGGSIITIVLIAVFGSLFTRGPFCSDLAVAGDWTSFQNGGEAAENAKVPLRWSADEGIRWQTTLAGYGQSSPVTDGETIYVTSTSGKEKENLHIEAFDLKTGKKQWTMTRANVTPQESSTYISRAAPTPVCDEQGVIALFEGGNVVALDRAGKIRWELDLVKRYGEIAARHGLGSSLEQDEKNIYVWVERSEKPYLLAVAKETGEVVWKSAGLGVTSWSSPRLVPVKKSHHLVLSGIGKLAGFDPQTGKQLWEFTGISGNSTPTPMPLGRSRFLIGATEGRGESGGGDAPASNGVIEITGNADDGFTAKYVWQAKKATSSFGSPVAHDGHAYFVSRSGVIYCLDIETGEQRYANRVESGSAWATPIPGEDRLFVFGKKGATSVIKTGPKFESLAVNALPETEESAVLYAAIVSGDLAILRTGNRIYGVDGK